MLRSEGISENLNGYGNYDKAYTICTCNQCESTRLGVIIDISRKYWAEYWVYVRLYCKKAHRDAKERAHWTKSLHEWCN